MNEDSVNTHKDLILDEQLQQFNQILRQHSEFQSTEGQKAADFPKYNVVADIPNIVDHPQPVIATENPNTLEGKTQDKKINLVLVATSLEESDVMKKLKCTFDSARSSMIPLKFDDVIHVSDKQNAPLSHLSFNEASKDDAKSDDDKLSKSKGKNRKPEKDKNARYQKQRSSNNEAAKKSRDARKTRFQWIEERAKALERENEILRKELEDLKNKVLEKEKASSDMQ